jgi:type I restriction enzyme R subunit
VQAQGRDDLREKLKVASGGVIFATIQKFLPDGSGDRYPLLSERRNVTVMVDEAHRSQYGLKGKLIVNDDDGKYATPHSERLLNVADSQARTNGKSGKPPSTPPGAHMVYGFARHMRDALPNASYIAFTGTPISLTDRNTRGVFGDCISIYDIQRAVEDGATVPIYYESRVAKLDLPEELKPVVDDEFEEVCLGRWCSSKRSSWRRSGRRRGRVVAARRSVGPMWCGSLAAGVALGEGCLRRRAEC